MAGPGRPKVSVVVPCFRSARFVERAVRSALAQTERDLEVVVVDNASDDATVEIARRIAREDPRVSVHVNPENVGPVRNWRRGLSLARGLHACLLFSDDWYEPTFLAEALGLLAGDASLGFVYSTARIVFEDADLGARRTQLSYRLAGPPVHESGEFLAEIFERGMQGVPVSPCAALFRRDDLARWLDAELPDPHGAGYLAHGAGPDLWTYLQACREYPRFGHLEAPLVSFSAHGDNLTFRPGIRAAYALARLAFLESHDPPSVNAVAARTQAWLSLHGARDSRRSAAAPGLSLGAWLRLGPAVQEDAIVAAREAEVELAVAESIARDPRAVPGLPGHLFQELPPLDPSSPYRVTAIVSAYKATRFLRGCLEDLLAQTLHERGELDILVVDTGSPEDEASIVREFQARSPHVRYLRTEDRRTLYAAWNLGVLAARGRYLTNANADDRHRRDGLERLAAVLDARPDVALAYADQIWSTVANEPFEETTSRCRWSWLDATPRLLRTHCMVGPQPMWRREVHARYGLFDDGYASAGDWEFWMRIGAREKLAHVDDVLGLYYLNAGGIEHSSPASRTETLKVRERYGVAPWERSAGSSATVWELPADRERPAASIVVLAGPSGDLFTSALSSAALQTVDDMEIVVVETDHRVDAGAVLARLRARRPGLRVRLVRHRGTASSARNAGAAAAQGRFILPMGADDLLDADFLAHALAALARDPMAAIAYGERHVEGGTVTCAPMDPGALQGGVPVATSALFHRRVLTGPAATAFDPDRSGDDADRDLWLRCAARGLRAVRVEGPIFMTAGLRPRARTA